MTSPNNNTAAVLFDLDGTLVNNMDYHAESFRAFLANHNLPPLDESMRHRIDGKRNRDIFPILFDCALEDETLRRYALEKEEHYRNLTTGKLTAIAGIIEFLDALERAEIPFGIATSAPELNVVHSLREIGLTSRFEFIVRSDQVPRGKPFPDVFEAGARGLKAEPSRCLVFEDAPAGIEGAQAAGMACVALTTSFDKATLKAACTPEFFIENYHQALLMWTELGLGTKHD